MSKRIMVIDDEPAIRRSFELALDESGYQVESVSSGKEGVLRLQKGAYDLVFLDLKMPGMNGVETLREIRKRDETIPVYIVTAFYGEFFDELRGMADAGTEFEVINKPVDADTIRRLCEGVLKGDLMVEE